MREHLATLLVDFRRYDRAIAVVRYSGIRRRVTTYGEIAVLAGRFASLLMKRGIGEGDRVLIWAENSAEWIAAFHGCLLRGVLAVPLDASGTPEFAARVAADVNPSLAIGDRVLVAQLPVGVPRLAFEDWAHSLPEQEAGPIASLSAEMPLEILFTSGTTGDPKGVVLTHGNVLASIGPIESASKPYLRYERLIRPLRILHTLPLSHVFGQTMGLWIPSLYRAELHFENRLVAARLVEAIRRERISVLAAVPRVHSLLKSYLESTLPGLADRVAGETGKKLGAIGRWWRYRDVHRVFGLKFWALISGGGALPPALESFWNAVGLVLVQGYGMTETTALITLNHPFHVAKGTIGKPLAGREVKLGPDGEVMVRGAAISHATWSGGSVHPRSSEWLATGDLARAEPTGELRFVGRKSEVIVTAAGVNLHPEDLESAIERQPEVTACAVVPLETDDGPEPCAVLALRGTQNGAAKVIEHANSQLAEFQRVRRWVVWPEPDLPRTSTGKVRRKAVAAGLARLQSSANGKSQNGNGHGNGKAAVSETGDWLVDLIAQISGETPKGDGDQLQLVEDLHLDSLGLVQLAGAIEERAEIVVGDSDWERVQTLGDVRRLLESKAQSMSSSVAMQTANGTFSRNGVHGRPDADEVTGAEPASSLPGDGHLYPQWPWLAPFRWIRSAFIELVMRPLVWLLGKPRVRSALTLRASEPMLIVCNHVTSIDVPLIEYALPAEIRRHIAVAMSAEMLNDYRHFRNPDRRTGRVGFFLPGTLIHFLLTTLFNVFPLPRQRDVLRSFAHAGSALDRGMNVLLFPEGTRSADGKLGRFRPGIGLLVKQSSVPVLPVALLGLGELKQRRRGWFRTGTLEIRIGKPLNFAPGVSESSITSQLQAAVEDLLKS